MDKKYEALFTPFRIGTCEIKNRVIIPAMEGTNIVDNMAGPKFNEKSHDYYIERAKNDVGLFIPGMIPVYSMISRHVRSWRRSMQTVLRFSSSLEPDLQDEIIRSQHRC